MKINLPKTAMMPEAEFEWKIPKWSNAIERDRATHLFPGLCGGDGAVLRGEGACRSSTPATRRPGRTSRSRKNAIGCGFHEAVRGVLSHHVVIRDGKIANYHPYPPTPWNANPRDVYGTPGPYEDAVQNTPIFEENGPEKFKGIDIMRAVRSFDPCLPCGVHMYLGNGKVLEAQALADVRGGRAGVMAASVEPTAGIAETREFRVHTERIERLVSRLDSCGDPELRANALELLQSVVELHGAALERMLESISSTPAGERALDKAIEDDLVASVLLLHGLHPDSIETRVLRALDNVRPYLRSHGGEVELVSVREGVVRIKLIGSCGSCPSSSLTVKTAVEDALYEAAPDIVELIAEKAEAQLNSARLVVLK